MIELSNLIRREASYGANARSPMRVGEVTSYNKETHAVKLKLQPEGIETGWVPLGSSHIGNGWGMATGAKAGDQMVVGFLDGDHSAPVVVTRMFSDQQKPPQVEGGEMILQHETGSKLVIDKDGATTLQHKGGGTITFDKDGHITIKSNDKNVTVEAGKGGLTYKGQSHSFEGGLNVKGSITSDGQIAAKSVTSGGLPVRTT